jgi:hypothetical protein
MLSTIVSRETRAQREPERSQSEKVFLAAAKPERTEPVFRSREPERPPTEFELGRMVEQKRGDTRVEEHVETPVTATPEPATMALVATGLASLAAAKRRRAKKNGLVNN